MASNDCSHLEIYVNFETYIETLRNATTNILSADSLKPCKQEICVALYGTGSSDISGIGVIVGYFVEFTLAVVLTLTLLTLTHRKKTRLTSSLRKITGAYVDSAIALALSVELACAIMLIKKNFGLGASEFGALTVQIVWIVATLVMLPVTSFCWQNLRDKRSELRLCMTALAFILFLITFICRMINTYSNRQIGSSGEAIINEDEDVQLHLLCFGAVPSLSPSGSTVVEIFSIGASLWISCNIVLALINQCIDETDRSAVTAALRRCTRCLSGDMVGTVISVSGLTFWSVPLFWALMTLRAWQKTFAASIDKTSGSDVWTFGQIIAVVVFLPVLNELLHQYLELSRPSREADEHLSELVHVDMQSPKSSSP